MGRPRKPVSLKVLHGDRKAESGSPGVSSPKGLGEPPAYLGDYGREAWAWIRSEAEAMGIGATADASAAAIYCTNYARWRLALESIELDGLTSLGQFGLKPNPNILIAEKAEAAMMKVLAQFGMTPSSRAGLHVGVGPKADRLGALLARKPPVPDGKSTKAR